MNSGMSARTHRTIRSVLAIAVAAFWRVLISSPRVMAGELPLVDQGTRPGLEFHVVADDVPPEKYQQLALRLRQSGPLAAGDATLQWFAVSRTAGFNPRTEQYQQTPFVLLWVTPENSLDHQAGFGPWGVKVAHEEVISTGETVVAFELDSSGREYFSTLTAKSRHRPLAIVVDGKVISAPTVQSRINGSGTISGGANGFTPQELSDLVAALNRGDTKHAFGDPLLRIVITAGVVSGVVAVMVLWFRRAPAAAT